MLRKQFDTLLIDDVFGNVEEMLSDVRMCERLEQGNVLPNLSVIDSSFNRLLDYKVFDL
jgi:hypothetical protein